MKIFLTPYYSSSWNVPILLYESLNWFEITENKQNQGWEAQKIEKPNFFQNDQFFELRCATYVLIFNLDIIYKPTIPSGKPIFQVETYPQMDSNPNLNVWT